MEFTLKTVINASALFCVIMFLFALKTFTKVSIWEEKVEIPTHEIGEPDLNPIFYNGRAYQGAQGHIYLYPLLDLMTDTCISKQHNMVYLENEYVKIGVLPDLGGRIFSVLDKKQLDFFYRQNVVKPALISVLGAWISGGVEWNVPHHHRASTYMPVQHYLEENPDSSCIIWIG